MKNLADHRLSMKTLSSRKLIKLKIGTSKQSVFSISIRSLLIFWKKIWKRKSRLVKKRKNHWLKISYMSIRF